MMHDPNEPAPVLSALIGEDAAMRIANARKTIDREYSHNNSEIPPHVIEARKVIDDEWAHAIASTREHIDITQRQTKRTNKTVVVLAVAILIMLTLGAAVSAFLVVRSDDLENIQSQLKATEAAVVATQARQDQVEQQHQAEDNARVAVACTLLHIVADNQTDKNIADAARTAIRQLDCP